MSAGRLASDGVVVQPNGSLSVVKIAIDPVWYLPGIAERFGVTETSLRRTLFEQTAGMFPELVTRPDLQVFLPPVGGTTVYLFGDVDKLADPSTSITCRVHDECNGSDVFGSDICTCRPYLVHGIEECARAAQAGGLGVIVYNRKEGRALGEVTKFLVYNARKRQEGGDAATAYFERTECVAGVQDARFQQLMPDVIHWLGLARIDRLVSMSDMKYDALEAQGIEIVERVAASRRAGARRCACGDRGQEGRRLLRAARARAAGLDRHRRPLARQELTRAEPTSMPVTPDTAAAMSLLSADAVRQRAHRLLAIGVGDRLAHFRIDLARLGAGCRSGRRDHAQGLPRPRGALPLALAAFRGGRAGSLGRDRERHATGATDSSARGRNSTSPSPACCSMPARDRIGPIAMLRPARRSADPRGWRWRALPCSPTARFRRSRESPLRADASALAKLTSDTLRRHFQVER